MTETMASDRQTWLAGQEYDLPDNEAKQAIKSKVAKEVKPKAEPKKDEPKKADAPKAEEPKPEAKPEAPAEKK